MAELTLEEMGTKITGLESTLTKFIAAKTANDDKTDKEKEAAIKKANDEKEEEKKEAKRAALEAAIKKANEEEKPKDKEAAIKKAMSDYGHEDKKEGKTAMTEEEKEKMAQVASIITDKKIDIDNKILQAATLTNPLGVVALKAELEKGTFTASKQIYDTMEKTFGKQIFQANITQQTMTQPPPFFMGGMTPPAEIDANQLNASSNTMDFAKLSTKDLLEKKV